MALSLTQSLSPAAGPAPAPAAPARSAAAAGTRSRSAAAPIWSLGEHPWTMDADRKPLSERQISRYIVEAAKRISTIIQTRTENALHLAELRIERLYAFEMDDRDWKGAHAKLMDLHRLQDL